MIRKKLTADWLKKNKLPLVSIPWLILASTLGWTNWKQLENYKQSKILSPQTATVTNVIDGDTFEIKNITVRLLGIDAPANDTKSTDFLKSLILNKKIWLEYDRYQDDKYSRILAWIWIDCESTPTFLPSDYMHKSQNESNPGLLENPTGCKKGKLVQEELIKNKFAVIVKYAERGEQKYEKRLQ
ncbi:MAG: thermonuclease family protein [Patescibacteria group bacterium]